MREQDAAYHVYVVELEPHGPRRLRSRGPHVYVGSTHLPTNVRLDHHLRGERASRHVRRHFRRIRPDLAPRYAFATRDGARRVEDRIARDLERRGYVVWGSCRPRKNPECVI